VLRFERGGPLGDPPSLFGPLDQPDHVLGEPPWDALLRQEIIPSARPAPADPVVTLLGTALGEDGADAILATPVSLAVGDLLCVASCADDEAEGEPVEIKLGATNLTLRIGESYEFSAGLWTLRAAVPYVGETLRTYVGGRAFTVAIAAVKVSGLTGVLVDNLSELVGVTANPSSGSAGPTGPYPQVWFGQVATLGLIADTLGAWNLTAGERVAPVSALGAAIKDAYRVVTSASGAYEAAIAGQTARRSIAQLIVMA
jgi:hypothetical protein